MKRSPKRFSVEPTIEEIRRKNKIHLNVKKKKKAEIKPVFNIDKQENINNKININNISNQLILIKKKILKEIHIIIKKMKHHKNKSINTNINANNIKTNRPKGKVITTIFASLISSIVIIGFIGVIIASIFTVKMLDGKPKLNTHDLIAPESSMIFDSKATVIAELGEYKRENVSYKEMPNHLIDAFLSIEDSRFFSHIGFDIPRFTKAIIENLKSGGFGQGGSTFDMQLIKNTYFQIDNGENSTIAQKSIQRKIQEIFLAIEMDDKISKAEIFANYLNRINFGNNIRGVEKAAQYYFGKSVKDISLSESAFLAGIINAPNIYNPYNEHIKYDENNIYVSANINYLQNGTKRRNEVLDMMVYHGYITKEEADITKNIKLEDSLAGVSTKWADSNPYYQSYIDAVIDEAKEITGFDPTVYSMKIYTNMDDYMQRLVYDIQNNKNPDVKFNRDDIQSAIVTMNNQTGEIIAIGGGSNQVGALQWNRATMSKIQPGSTIKPIFEYILAFDQLGWATSHTITDRPIFLYGSDHLIRNAGGQEYTGDMLLEEAVARSLNTPAIQALQAVIDVKGEQFCIDYLRSIGFDIDEKTFDLQYAIGGNTLQVSPVQLAGAHAIVLNGGRYIKPHTISKIEMNDGTIYTIDINGKQVVDPGAAYMVSTLEHNNVYGSWFNYMQILKTGYPVYAKTGTTDWGNSGKQYGIPSGAPKDSWLVASTDTYTNVIWLGFDKAGVGTYFRASDDSYNLKGRMGKKLLDSLNEYYDYNPGLISRPENVKDITHVKGLYPYIVPQIGSSVTGLIIDKYYKLEPISSIKYETITGHLGGISVSKNGENGLDIKWLGVGGPGGDGMQDLTATAFSGKTEYAVGRLFFPRYNYISPDATYYAEIKVNGHSILTIESNSSSAYAEIDANPGTIEVCGWYSLSSERHCETIE